MISGRHRNTIDKFYTKPDIVQQCIDLTRSTIAIRETDLIVEPSAGDGAFLVNIQSFHPNCKGYDISPEHHDIIRRDFLSLSDISQPVHIIGNPPFGRQSMICKRFIKKSIELGALSISFILPRSFKKESLQRTIDPYYHLIASIDLPAFSFLLDKQEYHVPCIYQIWEKQTSPRMLSHTIHPTYWKYVKREQQPHLSFRRIGLYAGEMSRECKKHESSHYFLTLSGVDIDTFLTKYHAFPRFSHNNTVGPKSISKHELNQVLITLL